MLSTHLRRRSLRVCSSLISDRTLSPLLRLASTSASAEFKNENIPYKIVQLVNSETNQLGDPTPLKDLLSAMDRNKQFIQLVSIKPVPVVKLHLKSEEAERRRTQRANKPKKKELKSIQMTWGIEPGDFSHKLGKARKELEKGNNIRLIIAGRGEGPRFSPQAKEEMMKRVVDLLKDVALQAEAPTKAGVTVVDFRSTVQ